MTMKASIIFISKIISTWFGIGLLRPCPGTYGTLAALPFAFFIHHYFGAIGMIVATIFLTIIGIYASQIYANFLQKSDPSEIVIDEVAGIFLALSILPVFDMLAYGLAFLLFRFFDIIKPWPIRLIDRKIKGGLGIMLDDLLAGFFAMMLLYIFIYFTGLSSW